jgi:hypothetical protein
MYDTPVLPPAPPPPAPPPPPGRPIVSVTQPIGPALERVKLLLFRPFDAGKWFVIGFCAWLAQLGERGCNTGSNLSRPFSSDHGSFADKYAEAHDYLIDNLAWIVPLALGLLVVGLVVGIVVLWLNSRGKFMFLHCVVHDRAEIAVPWNLFAQQADSLFGFRLVLALSTLPLVLPIIALLLFTIVPMALNDEADAGRILVACALVVALVCVLLVFAVIGVLIEDIVVPIMFLRRNRSLAAWREAWSLIRTHAAGFVLYLVFRFILGVFIVLLVLTVMIVTCCCACCLFVLPYIGTVALLPVLTFVRAYSLYYLAQYGREFDVFAAA